MPKYVFVINGKNFKMNFNAKIQRVGFRTTRRLEAKNVRAAEKAAHDMIKNELKRQILNERNDPPVLETETIHEVDSFSNELTQGKGFAWYVEEDEGKNPGKTLTGSWGKDRWERK